MAIRTNALLALLIDFLFGIGSLWRRAILALIGVKMSSCERYYQDPPESVIFEMFMFSIKHIKNTSGS